MHRTAPLSVCWQLTSQCNYKCGFCYRFKGRPTLDISSAKIVLDSLADAGVTKVTFSGGEPLLWKPLSELLAYASYRGVITSLITNGSLLHGDNIELFANVLDWITLPLDSPDDDSNVAMGRSKGHASHALRLIKTFAQKNVKVKVNSVVSSINATRMPELARLIESLPVTRWKLFQFYDVRDDAKKNAAVYQISDLKFVTLCDKMRQIAMRPTLNIDTASNKDLEGNYFTIVPNGDVYVSNNGLDERLGNLLTASVTSLFSDERFDRENELKRHAWLLHQESPDENNKSNVWKL